MEHQEDPLSALGAALACALIAQALNVLIAALVAAQMPGGYRVRSWVFLATVLWTIAGTVLLLIRTAGASTSADSRTVRFGRIALWLVSSWLWPVLAHRHRPTSGEQNSR